MRPSHRKHNRAWSHGPKAWHHRARRTWPAHYGLTDILKAAYPQARIQGPGENLLEIPIWARLAYERHWIGTNAYHAVPPEWLGRMTVGYDDHPFFGLLKKNGLWPSH